MKNQDNLDYLDGLRGIAILLVVIFHFWQITWLNHSFTVFGLTFDFNFLARGGFIGVEIFFFISGFCLYLPHARHTFFGKQIPSIARFTYKRAIKILPSYYLAIILTFAFSDIPFQSSEQFIKTIASHIFFTNNIFTSLPKINGVFWSLAVEIQFYILFPLIAFFFRKKPFILFLILILIANGFRQYALNFDIQSIGYYTAQMPASLDLFACGMIAAHLFAYIKSSGSNATSKKIFIILATLCTITSLAMFSQLTRWYYDGLSLGIESSIWQAHHRLSLGVVLICITVSGIFSHRIWQRVIANPLFIFLSAISYNLYIWHQLIGTYIYSNNIITSTFSNPREDLSWQLSVLLLSLILSCIVATLLTYFFERPFMRLNWRTIKNQEIKSP